MNLRSLVNRGQKTGTAENALCWKPKAQDVLQIEFPSILLPPDIATGSVVDVNVSRNFDAEVQASKAFDNLQSDILTTFGSEEPETPVLRCRNATQTSVVLEWDPISLATANLRSLALYRNGGKAGLIPRPLEMTSTKISGLAVDTEYTFSLVLRTSAGTYSSEKLTVKTHKMTDLTGITVTPGIMAPQIRSSLETTIEKIGAKLIEQIRIDTTHFVCTEGRGPAFEKAREMNIPVVLPDWVIGCQREGRLVGVRGYYLDANPKDRQIGQRPQSSQQPQRRSVTPERGVTSGESTGTPTTNVIPPTPERKTRGESSDEDSGPEEQRVNGAQQFQEQQTWSSDDTPKASVEATASPVQRSADEQTNGDLPKQSEDEDRNSEVSAQEPDETGRAEKRTEEGEKFDEVTL